MIQELSGLPQDDVEERLSFYGEMIEDWIEEGLSEAEAVAAMGDVAEIVRQTVADTSLVKIAKERIRPKRHLKGWETVYNPKCNSNKKEDNTRPKVYNEVTTQT